MGNRRKKYITFLFLLAVETSFLVLAMRAVDRPLWPDRFPCSTQIVRAPGDLTRHISFEKADDWPRLLGERANLRATPLEPIVAIAQQKPSPKLEVDVDRAVPLIRFLSRLKIPTSRSDEPSLIG